MEQMVRISKFQERGRVILGHLPQNNEKSTNMSEIV